MELHTLFRRAVATSIDKRGKPATLGRLDGVTLFWTDPTGTVRRDKVWARIGESASNQEVVVRCTTVTPQVEMPVRVDMVNGVLSVIDVDEARYLEFTGYRPGGNVGAHAWTHQRLGPDPLYIEGLSYLPLLVHPTSPASMAVTVEQGAYRWDGDYNILETADSSSLSGYIPGSSAVKHFVVICLDRDNNAIAILDGSDVTASGGDALFGSPSVTIADVVALTIPAAYAPLAAVLLYYGQTTVRAMDIVMDLRQWGNEATGLISLDNVNDRIGMGTDSPSSKLDIANTESSVTPETGLQVTNTFSPTSAPGSVFPQSLTLTASYNSAQNASGFQLAQFLDVRNAGNGVISARNLDTVYRNQGTGTVARADMIYIRTPQNTGGGAITLAHGLYIEDQNIAATNWAIKTNAGQVYHGDNVLVGTETTPGGTEGKTLIFGDNGGDPQPGNNTAGLFAKDVSGTVEMFAVDEADNVTQISPHDPLTGEWVFYSVNQRTGKTLRIDMEQMMRRLDEMLGGGFIHEFIQEIGP